MTTTILQNAFLPTQISSCTLWLDGADPNATGVPPTSGATVSTWRDKSSTANNFTGSATYTLDSVYNKYGLSFNGSTNYFSQVNGSLYSITNTTYTIFTVHRFYFDNPSNGVGEVYRRAGGGAFWFRQIGGAVQWITDTDPAGYIQVSGTAASLSGIGCINTITTSSATAYLNGTSVGSGARSTTTNIAFAIGHATVTELLQGAIFEMIIYNTTITTAQRQQVEGYLAAKWGLQSSLPATHPYKYGLVTTLPSVSTIISQNGINRFNNALFLPTSIPGCKLWFDATDTTSIFSDTGGTTQITQGGSVARWNDKSGNNNYLQQGNAGIRPVYQKTPGAYNGLYFLDSTKQLTTINNNPVTGNAARTIFLIQQAPAVGAVTTVGTGTHAGNTPPSAFGFTNATSGAGTVWCPYVYTAADNTFSAIVTTLAEQWAYYDPSVSQVGGSYNFITPTTKSTTLNTTASTWYFGRRDDNGGCTNGYICEFILYDSVLTTAQRQQIEGYLAWKWGLVSNLPLSHPYKAAPFTPFSAIVSVASLLNTNQLNSKLITTFFNPKNISAIALWLDGADTSAIQTSGSSVTQWNDKSGSGNNMTPYNGTTIGLSKLNNQSIINFGTGIMYTPAFTWSTSYTMIFVAFVSAGDLIFNTSRSSGTIYGDYVYTGNGTLFNLNNSTTNSIVLAATDSLIPLGTTVISRGSWFMLCIGYNSSGTAALNYTINGTVRSTSVFSGSGGFWANPALPLWINGNYGGGSFGTCQIAEVIHYNASITTNQRQQLEGYLSWKWGLQANLPSTHPYKVFPPPPN